MSFFFLEPSVASSFNPEDFLLKTFGGYAPPTDKKKLSCPRCGINLIKGVVTMKDKRKWTYYRCPSSWGETKCYISCGEEDIEAYTAAFPEQIAMEYEKENPANFNCYCGRGLICKMSKSQNNPQRLYFACIKRGCSFFHWIDEPPKEEFLDILRDTYTTTGTP